MSTSLPPLVDERALEKFLAERLPGETAPVEAQRLSAGHSNETFYITRGQDRWVLRRPPLPPYLPTAHDVGREYRFISALQGTQVPVPKPVLFCENTSVIGAPFYLMERLPGVVIRSEVPPQFDNEESGRQIAEDLIQTLVKLHAVDWRQTEIASIGKPEGYIARQIKRWTSQLEGAYTRPIPELLEVRDWLVEHMPESPPATIVHGDFRIDNCMYSAEPPAQVIGVLDWEMATLGDPLADLGYLLSYWRDRDEPESSFPRDMGYITIRPGFPTRAEVMERYAELSGRKIGDINFYIALAIWKLAVLLEGSYKRHLSGQTDDPFFASLKEGVPALGRRALRVCKGGEFFVDEQ
jgi:aminoglycoside phosphotransferase (APT) family kinase protein